MRKIDLVKKYEAQLIAVCSVLLAMAAWWLISTRPAHRIEGDFFQREHLRETADGWLAEQIRSSIGENRARACLALGRIGDAEYLRLLIPALDDPSPRVRMTAAFAIGQIEAHWWTDPPRPEAAEALLETLDDEERAVVAAAVEALGKMRWAPALEPLKATAAPLPFTLAAMSRIADPAAVPWIRDKLKSDDQDVRWAAARALNEMVVEPDEGSTLSFVNLAKDLKDRVRVEAARALGRAAPKRSVWEALGRLCDDPDPNVRIAALHSLGALGASQAFEPVASRLGDANRNVRAAAAAALGRLGDPQAIPLLAETAKTEGPPSRAARRALQKLAPDRYELLDSEADRGEVNLLRQAQPHEVAFPRGADSYSPEDYQRIARTLNRFVRMETSIGAMELLLDFEQAALTSETFGSLVRQGSFDGRRFAAAEPNRWLATGAPAPAGERPPPVTNEVNPRQFLRGSLGIRADQQGRVEGFFICLSAQPLLDGRYTNFGRLISGDDLLDRVTTETRILSMTVLER